MAYPEPIPVIRRKADVEEFRRRLKNFELSAEQKKLYQEAIKRYQRKHSKRAGSPEG